MAASAARGRWSEARVQAREFRLRHPEWWVLLAAAAAWALMIAVPHSDPHAGHGASHGAASTWPGLRSIALMVVAMMAPLTISGVRHVALGRPPHRRRAAVAEFMAGYLGVWLPAAVVVALAWSAAAAAVPWPAAVAATVGAAVLWELAPARRRHLARCERTVPLAPHGWRADRDCLRFGAERGVSCIATCWALMAVCAAFGHSVLVMAILFAVRLAPHRQRQASPALAVAGVCLAAVVGVAW
jgi:predicted metal-binding membrane protein